MTTLQPEVSTVRSGLRRLLWGRAVSALDDALWFTIWALYFTRALHLSAATVGLAMGLAGGAGLALAIPIGTLADRYGPRGVLVTVTVVRAAAMAGYLLLHGTWAFLAVTVVFTAPANGATAARTAMVAGLVTDTTARMRTLAQQRVAQRVGYALGAGLGALVLSADRPAGYLAAIRRGTRSASWSSPPCSTDLPLSLSGAVVVISSIGIAVLQVPASRLARGTGPSARTATWSGIALAVS